MSGFSRTASKPRMFYGPADAGQYVLKPMQLVNARSAVTIANDVNLALTRSERRTGLLGRDSLAPSAALVLSPCGSIHTMFMRFPIDVVFVDRDGRALRI